MCFSLNDKNYNREVSALFEASKELECNNLTIYLFEIDKSLNINKIVDNKINGKINIKYPWEI